MSCGTLHLVRIDNSSDDVPRGLNRAEHVRQHHPESSVYQAFCGWREDAESGNAVLDSTLWLRRPPAYKPERQHLFMLGHAIARNSIARCLLRRNAAAPPGQAAA